MQGEWKDIATAPKDGSSILAAFPSGNIVIARWVDDRYAKNPKPYWGGSWSAICGKMRAMANQPTFWQPLPPPPNTEE